MKKSATLLLSSILLTPVWAKGLKDIENFFNAQAVVIKALKNSAIADKGLPYFKPGFPVAIFSGTEVENPLTHKVEFVAVSQTGSGEVLKSTPNYSVIKLTENRGVKKGNVVQLNYKTICFIGSDRTFAKLQEKLPVEKVKNADGCRWTVKETPTGYEILLNGREVFFAEKNLPSYALGAGNADINSVNILVQALEMASYREIPTSVDAITVGQTTYTAVSFPEGIKIYQVVGGDAVGLTYIPTPVGKIVRTQLFTLNGNLYIIGVAFTSDGEPVSFIATLVGANAVITKGDIPYILTVLDKNRPLQTLVVQKFDNGFGEVYRANFDGSRFSIGKKLNLPKGIRTTSATLTDDGTLAFVNGEGELEIYRGSLEEGFKKIAVLNGGFGKSYTYINLPFMRSGKRVFFAPRPIPITLFGVRGFLVAHNIPKKISTVFLNSVVKFKGGKLYFVAPSPSGLFVKKELAGYTFKDSVQGLAIDQKGTPFAVSGYSNPFLFVKKGNLYRLEFKYF